MQGSPGSDRRNVCALTSGSRNGSIRSDAHKGRGRRVVSKRDCFSPAKVLSKLNLCRTQHFKLVHAHSAGGGVWAFRSPRTRMSNLNPSSVTLIFYRLGPLRQEPLLNIVASALQWSSFCHTEIAIGENRTPDGAMVNVARVFNDSVGVVKRTKSNTASLAASSRSLWRVVPGRSSPPEPAEIRTTCTSSWAAPSSPRNECCSLRGLRWASPSRRSAWRGRSCGRERPTGPAGATAPENHGTGAPPRRRALVRRYCAELTAAVLQVGGLLHKQSNPGAATPSSLYELFAPRAAVAANPFKIHLLQQHHKQQQENQHDSEDAEPLLQLGLRGAFSTPARTARTNPGGHQRQHFKSLATHPQMCTISNTMLTSGLTLNSLTTPTYGHR